MCAKIEIGINIEGISLEQVTACQVRKICQTRKLLFCGDMILLFGPIPFDIIIFPVNRNSLAGVFRVKRRAPT